MALSRRFRVCVIGSGPAGFYTAQSLSKLYPAKDTLEIDMLERLPTPYGLVRYGVAPDHPSVKNCENQFEAFIKKEEGRVQWIGGVSLGETISLKDLCQVYDAVVIAIGAQRDKKLNIKGEDTFKNVYSSMQWVRWMNGYPSQDTSMPSLSGCEHAVVIGNGNVALDVARMLITPVSALENTDISAAALKMLKTTSVRHISIAGRRGPGQLSFTTAELREIFQLAKAQAIPVFTDALPEINQLLKVVDGHSLLPRPLLRSLKLFQEHCQPIDNSLSEKSLSFRFYKSPTAFEGDKDVLKAVSFEQMEIQQNNETSIHEWRVKGTGKKETIKADLAVKCIGYALGQIPSLPSSFQHPQSGLVYNHDGKVYAKDSDPLYNNLFVAGWCQSGPVGVLADSLMSAKRTASSISTFFNETKMNEKPGRAWLMDFFRLRNTPILLFDDWLRINEQEITAGKQWNKPREKLTEIESLNSFKHPLS